MMHIFERSAAALCLSKLMGKLCNKSKEVLNGDADPNFATCSLYQRKIKEEPHRCLREFQSQLNNQPMFARVLDLNFHVN